MEGDQRQLSITEWKMLLYMNKRHSIRPWLASRITRVRHTESAIQERCVLASFGEHGIVPGLLRVQHQIASPFNNTKLGKQSLSLIELFLKISQDALSGSSQNSMVDSKPIAETSRRFSDW